MGLLLAAALAAHIHSGSDLLAACSSRDTSACDAFIQATVRAHPETGCVSFDNLPNLREFAVRAVVDLNAADKPAAFVIIQAFGGECSAAD